MARHIANVCSRAARNWSFDGANISVSVVWALGSPWPQRTVAATRCPTSLDSLRHIYQTIFHRSRGSGGSASQMRFRRTSRGKYFGCVGVGAMYVLRSEVGSRPSSRPVIPTSINMSKCINYMAFETAELLQQMRDGINVPSNPPEQRSWSWTEK
jgi:hypothetical protein